MFKIGIECESIEDQSWGVGRIVKKLLEEISKRPELQKEFKFFLYFKSRVPPLAFLDNSIFVKKVIRLPFLPPSFSLYYYLLLPIKLWFEKLDLMFFPNYMLPILFRGKSLVMLTEDVYYEFKQGTLPFRYRLAYKIFANWAAKHATKIMAISETSKQEISKLFKISSDRIVVNPLGVDVPKLDSSSMPHTLNPKPYLLYVGQAFPRRHLKETMLAYEKIVPILSSTTSGLQNRGSSISQPNRNDLGEIGTPEFPGLKLIAIGKDKYNPPVIEKLKNKINSRLGYDGIIYKEYVPEDELWELYASAKTLVYVSTKEAFGLPPLEALNYGVPAVVAKQEITREIFGNNAFFVNNPDSPEAIAEAIKMALTDEQKRREIVRSAPEILAKYTWQKHTDKFLNIVRGFK